jgi:hypothetical protein
VEARVSQPLGLWSFESPGLVPVVVLVLLVLLEYGGLCSFLSFFSFSLVVAGKHSIEAPEGVSPPVVGGMTWLYFSFYQSLKPDLCCFAALSSTRAPQPCSSSSSGFAAASFDQKDHR